MWDGNSAPRLLERTLTEGSVIKREPITTFSWGDESDKVKIYIPWEGASELTDDAVTLEWTATSLDLSISKDNLIQRLNIESLHDVISDAKVRRKASKLIVTLVKETSSSWYELKKT
jgi:hypothetical protein